MSNLVIWQKLEQERDEERGKTGKLLKEVISSFRAFGARGKGQGVSERLPLCHLREMMTNAGRREAVFVTENERQEIRAQKKERSFYWVEGPLIGLMEAIEGGLWAANLDLVIGNHEE